MASYFTKISLLLIALITMITEAKFENICKGSDQGKHFIVTFPTNYQYAAQDPTNELHIKIVSSHNKTIEVNITSLYRLSNNSYFMETVNVEPMSFGRVVVPNEMELNGTERSYKTIEIMADFDISVHIIHLRPNSTDVYLAIPTDYLGTQYVVGNYDTSQDATLPGLFAIYGVLNDTTVTIQLNASITFENTSYTSGDILTLQVSRLEAVQITSSGDLTGTIISSDYPIGVINGDACALNFRPATPFNIAILTPGRGCDVLLEQSIPVSNWGRKHFYSATGKQTGPSKYRIVAFYNDTSFIVNSTNITLDSGEFRDFDLTGNGIINSTKPASLKQILTRISGGRVAPSLLQVPAENQFVSKLGFTTPTKSGRNANGFNNFVSIIVKTNERQSLRLNGNQITNTNPSSSKPYIVHEGNITGSDYDLIVVRLPRVENVYFITQELADSSPMSATVYGYEFRESYGYIAGLSLPCNTQTAPPSPPNLQSSINSFNTSTCSADITLTWMTPPSNRIVNRYFLYLDGFPLVTTTSNSYTHSTILSINTGNQFSLTASSCAGNSTSSSTPVHSFASYRISKEPITIQLYQTNNTAVLGWDLFNTHNSSQTLLIEYYLQANYSNTTGVPMPFQINSTLNLLSNVTTHTIQLESDGVMISLSVSLQIMKQCGQNIVGEVVMGNLSTIFPTTIPTSTTLITTTVFPTSSIANATLITTTALPSSSIANTTLITTTASPTNSITNPTFVFPSDTSSFLDTGSFLFVIANILTFVSLAIFGIAITLSFYFGFAIIRNYFATKHYKTGSRDDSFAYDEKLDATFEMETTL